jgi:hypothetical protein
MGGIEMMRTSESRLRRLPFAAGLSHSRLAARTRPDETGPGSTD